MENLLGGPDPTLLDPALDDAARDVLDREGARAAARSEPAASLPWAVLAEAALADDPVAAYAYARTGYHRGLDALRRAGWRGTGPVPADHRPNQGFLRALLALADAADAIGETEEGDRCRRFLADSGTSVEAVRTLR